MDKWKNVNFVLLIVTYLTFGVILMKTLKKFWKQAEVLIPCSEFLGAEIKRRFKDKFKFYDFLPQA